MKIGNRNVKVLKERVSKDLGMKVELTSKMTIKGEIIKAVVVTNIYTGKHLIIKTFNNIAQAYEYYNMACIIFIDYGTLKIALA